MKKVIAFVLAGVLAAAAFTRCTGGKLTTSGCTVIRDDGEYVTYQTVCENCGYEFGSPVTIYAYKVNYNVTCTQCGELIFVQIDRK